MPDLGDFLSVLQSLFSAAGITFAAYGYGRPLARLLSADVTDRLDRGVGSLLLGFPAAGGVLAGLGIAGYLNPDSVAVVTLVGVLSATVEAACSIASYSGRVAGAGAIRQRLAASSTWSKVAACLATVVLCATLITALTPPTDALLLAQTFDGPKQALLAGSFWNGDRGALELPSLPQIWSLWGMALDGPVAANLVHWQLTVVVALAAVLVARKFVTLEVACLAGLLVIASPLSRTPSELLPSGASALAASLMLVTIVDALQRGRWNAGQFNLALAALIAGLPGTSPPSVEYSLWHEPLLLVALAGLAVGPARHRAALIGAAVAGLLAATGLLGWGLIATALPVLAIAGAVGASNLLSLPRPARGALTGVAACLGLVLTADLASNAFPQTAVALGFQSRETYLLAHSGSYRAATVFNQIRHPGHRLLSMTSECYYFASPTTLVADEGDSLAAGETVAATLVAEAHRRGCDFLLTAHTVEDAEAGNFGGNDSKPASLPGEMPETEKIAAPVEVIPIVAYEFADDYQRTTRYRLWKLQGRRAAASPTLDSATSGEEVSSRPRLPTR